MTIHSAPLSCKLEEDYRKMQMHDTEKYERLHVTSYLQVQDMCWCMHIDIHMDM